MHHAWSRENFALHFHFSDPHLLLPLQILTGGQTRRKPHILESTIQYSSVSRGIGYQVPDITLVGGSIYPRADPEQCCWGGARTVGGCELDGAKRRRASATEAARSACRGSCGRGLGAQK